MTVHGMTILCAIVCSADARTLAPTSAELSGVAWVSKFSGSSKLEDLESGFRAKVEAFSSALKAAGASTEVTSTLRPKQRAYLMHWSWQIAKKNFDPKKVPAMDGVDISWWHGDAATSKVKASEMVDGYQIGNLGVAPALASRHTEGKAIDMQVTWSGTRKVKENDGKEVTIDAGPRDSTNPVLIRVGKTYGVIHFLEVSKDEVHWSTDGH